MISEAEKETIKRGAKIVIEDWVRLKKSERLLIVTSDDHMKESQLIKKYAVKRNAKADIMIVDEKGVHVGMFFDENEHVFDNYHAVIGATNYSIVTTKATRSLIDRGGTFLSLPLSTTDGNSMLGYDFMTMDTKKSKLMAHVIMRYLDEASTIRVTTKAGTDLFFSKHNRKAGFFNGVVKDGNGYSSASIEAYVPIEETKTEGTMVIDGSLGYIGRPKEPIKITFEDGHIVTFENSDEGRRLEEYIKSYEDDRMLTASEFGIGLNSLSKCNGNCYIEDESSYGTFHIGLGRNLALGGTHEASGHFDIVAFEPDIFVDNRQIMQAGKIIIPEPQVY